MAEETRCDRAVAKNIFVKTPGLRQLSLYSSKFLKFCRNWESGAGNRDLAAVNDDGSRRTKFNWQTVATVRRTAGPGVQSIMWFRALTTLTVNPTRMRPAGRLVNQTEAQILAHDYRPGRISRFCRPPLENRGTTASAFVFSVIITYLLLVALYRSFLYILVIMATVPMGLDIAQLGCRQLDSRCNCAWIWLLDWGFFWSWLV